jgi:hypothetical protein
VVFAGGVDDGLVDGAVMDDQRVAAGAVVGLMVADADRDGAYEFLVVRREAAWTLVMTTTPSSRMSWLWCTPRNAPS